jgi:adenylate cyclase
MALLRDYHAAMGPIVASFEGTLDHCRRRDHGLFQRPAADPRSGKTGNRDGGGDARDDASPTAHLAAARPRHRLRGRHFSGLRDPGPDRLCRAVDYTAIGTVTNLAARLCAEAKDGQILISARVAIAVEDSAALEEIGDLSLKGLSQAVAVYNVVAVGTQPSTS